MVDLKDVKVKGQGMSAITMAFLSEGMAKSIIERSLGVSEVDPNQLYPVDKFHSMLRDIEENMIPQVLRKVGTKIIEAAIWPPQIKSAEDALAAIDAAYKMNHEPNDSDKIGTYTFKKIGDIDYEIHCDNVYPCDLDEGIIYGAAKKFHPKAVAVKHAPGTCRKNGDSLCIYQVKLY